MTDRSLSVNENSGLIPVGSPVVGTDPDAGQTLTYSLSLSGNTGSVFAISATTAQLSVINNALDFEAQPV